MDLEADYVIVGAGAVGMAFADALVDNADVKVVVVERRHHVGGHWLDAYPFVRLHTPSDFYGVASCPLGGGRLQESGPEAGWHVRANASEILAYYSRILERMVASGQVSFYFNCDYIGDGQFESSISGERYRVTSAHRVVDARYLSPEIPATTSPPFDVSDGARVLPVNDLVDLDEASSQYVIVGSGKTSTDAVVWLLDNGVDPDAICWVRPRDPWMLNRALLQPDPVVLVDATAVTMEVAASATSPDDLFLGLEAAGITMRIDRSVAPTMGKFPVIAQWELDRLRSVQNVVRMGHLRQAGHSRLRLENGEVATAKDAVVVHCAASGLAYPPLVPIWSDTMITLQPNASSSPCLSAALAGYVEATVEGDDRKNRLLPPLRLPNAPLDWVAMYVAANKTMAAVESDRKLRAWAARTALNKSRIPPEKAGTPQLTDAMQRLEQYRDRAMYRMAKMVYSPQESLTIDAIRRGVRSAPPEGMDPLCAGGYAPP